MSVRNGDHSPNLPQQEESLLSHPNFVAKSPSASFEPGGLAWKAGTLPSESLPQIHSYFGPYNQLCQKGSVRWPGRTLAQWV